MAHFPIFHFNPACTWASKTLSKCCKCSLKVLECTITSSTKPRLQAQSYPVSSEQSVNTDLEHSIIQKGVGWIGKILMDLQKLSIFSNLVQSRACEMLLNWPLLKGITARQLMQIRLNWSQRTGLFCSQFIDHLSLADSFFFTGTRVDAQGDMLFSITPALVQLLFWRHKSAS